MQLILMHSQKQELKQELSYQQRVEQVQKLAHQVSQELALISDWVGDDPEDVLPKVLAEVLSLIKDNDLKVSVEKLINGILFKEAILDKADNLAMPTELRITDFVLRHIHDLHQGKLPDPRGGLAPIEIDQAVFVKGFLETDKVKAEIERWSKPGRTGVDPKYIAGLQNSLMLKSAYEEAVKAFSFCIALILNVQDKNQHKPLLNFLREMVIMDHLRFFLSERMSQRFCNSFRCAHSHSSETLRKAFLNTIGEFVLVGLGILSPSLFSLNKFEPDSKWFNKVTSELKELGLPASQLRHLLPESGVVFFNRWRVLGKPLSQVTDQKILQFIIQTVRADQEPLMPFYRQIKREAAEITSEKGFWNDQCVALTQVFADLVSDEGFQEVLQKLITEKWYHKLEIFWR